MPDGDHFCWKVRGPGSRKLVEVALGGNRIDIVADHAIDMVVRHLNDPEHRLLLPRILRGLRTVCSRDGSTLEDLQRELRHIAGESDVASVAAKSAESLFVSRFGGDNYGDISAALLAQFAGDLIEARALTHARTELLKEYGRSHREHCKWIHDLRDAVGRELESKVESVYGGSSRIRPPRRLAKRRRMTLEELHEPIARQTL